ncbi:MAG: translocation/assembly module TamB domain-containing protein [Ferruginibacter sp.]
MKWAALALLFWVTLAALFFFVFSANRWVFFLLLAGWLTAWFFVFKKSRHKAWFIGALLIFLLSSWGLINYAPVQNFLISKVTKALSEKLHTRVEIKHVEFSLFNKMLIEGVLVEDKQRDTLLYAGTAKVNITDWFFLKDKATLKYLGLKNTLVNMHRSDSVWNYQFLLDYFSSPKKSSSSNKGGLEFDFKTLELENIRFIKADQWVGQDMTIAVSKAGIVADSLDLPNKHFAISSITLDQPYFSQTNYTGNRSKLNIQSKKTVSIPVPQQFKWNNEGWVFNVNSIHITNGAFQNEKETERAPYTDRFDGQHLLFSAINGDIKNISFNKDTLWADISLATKERSGFEVKKIKSHVKFTPDIMEFNQLDIVTNKSRLGSYYAMKYEDFNSDMNDFIHRVTLNGRFENSKVASDDIAFFAPTLKDWHRVFELEGNAKGTIDNLSTKNMVIKSGSTIVDGDISLRGLPDIENTFIDFKSNNLVTNYNDLVTIIPSLKNVTQPRLSRLGDINFKGTFTGFINDFVTYGNISTSLGNIIADLNMKLPANQPPTYSGKLSSGGFNLGQFIENKDLGNIALDGNVTGRGFTMKDLKASFRGDVKKIYFSGYDYSNIVVDGSFDKKLFTGNGSINDPNLKLDDFHGSIDFTGVTPTYDFDAKLRKSNFKTLRLSKDDFSLSGHLNLNFTGTNIDNFSGTARVYDAELRHDSTRLSFDSLTLKSYLANGKKRLEFQTNELEGNITGEFSILQLPDAFSLFLNRYYPAYIAKPKKPVSNEDFSFYIRTRNADEFVQLVDKRLKGFDDAEFSGNINLAKNELNVKGNIPFFRYDGKTFNNVILESKGNLDTLITKITTGDIGLNDSLHFPGTHLLIKSHNDVSTLQLKTSASKTLNEAELNATVTTLNDGVKIHFSPSSFIINDKKWELENDGELTIHKSYIDASEVKFVQGEQEITFATEEAQDGTDNVDVVAYLKKVNINDFTPLFLKKPRLEGILTGKATLKNPFGDPYIEFTAQTQNLRLDDKLIGNVPLEATVDTKTGLITYKAGTENDLYKFKGNGTYNYKDTTGNNLNVNLAAERFDLSILDNYLGSVFSEIKGNANTTLNVYGNPEHQFITGTVNVDSCSLKVNYTQCRYKFSNKTIIFNPDEIDLGTLQVKDTLGNTGTASGKLKHKLFDAFDFENLSFETSRMLLLNTTKKDNNQFYGKAIGSARMTLNGPITDMRMKITGKTSGVDSSHIFLPTGDSKEAGKIDYIEFVKFGREMESSRYSQATNMFIDMDLEATPACKIDVILDEATGDIIKGQGNGKLNIKVGTREPITMRGQYNITQGEYKFNFQTVLQKYFNIRNGSTITWDGDPYEARIKINAEYLAQRVDLSSLSSSSGKQIKQKSDLSIIAHLTNTLKKPQISFEFLLPQDNDVSKDPIVLENLKKFTRDQNEMNRQVASLLLFNTFVNESGGGLGNSTSAFLAGTVGQVISGYLNSQLTRFFQRVFNDPSISPYLSLNSNYDITNPELIKALQASGNFGFRKEYLEGRLVVSLGGNIDYNNPYILQARNTNILLTPDITVEYILSKDGKLRIVGFQKTSVDATLGQRNKTGVRLSYQKEFDKKRYRTSEADKPRPRPEIKGNPGKS